MRFRTRIRRPMPSHVNLGVRGLSQPGAFSPLESSTPTADASPRTRFPHLLPARVLKGLALLVALLALSLSFREKSLLLHPPLSEDGYYSMTIARNIAGGRGVSVDGRTPTNGFQPLFTFLSVPVFVLAGPDRILGVRLFLALHWLFYVATAAVLGRILRDALDPQDARGRTLAPWYAATVYLCLFPVFGHHFNGLETGCLLLSYAVVLRYAQTHALRTPAEAAVLGALLGLVVLSRIDAVFFVILVCAYLFLFLSGGGPAGARLRPAATVAATAFLVSSPWWFYSVFVFGSLLPSSGAAEQAWALDARRLGVMATAILRNLMPVYLHDLDERVATDGVRALLLVGVLVLLWTRRGEVGKWRFANAVPGGHLLGLGCCLALSSLMLALWYALSSWAVHFYARYLAPLLLLVVLALARALFALAEAWPGRAVALLLLLGLSVPFEVVRSYREPIIERNIFVRRQLTLVESRVPPEEWVAALQTGTLGYFRDRVLNLDGKVNPQALRRRHDIWRYLDEQGVRWLCDWPELFRPFFGSRPEDQGWELRERSGKFALYERRTEK
jgi:hypothetical protein